MLNEIGLNEVLHTIETHNLDDKPDKASEVKHVIEVQFSNEEDLVSVYEELLSRGFIVRCK